MKRRSIALLLAVSLILLMPLIGCSSEENGDATEEESQGTEEGGQSEEGSQEMETYSFSVMLNGLGADDENSVVNVAWREKMESLMGMKLDIDYNYVPSGDYDDKMKIQLNSGDLPDYFLLPFLYDYEPMAREGFFLDLSEYDMSNYLHWVDQAHDGRLMAIMDNGMMPVVYTVGLPTVEEDRMPIFQTNSMYNYSAFQREGLEIPETLDELYTAAKQLKEKYPDSYPINTNYIGLHPVFQAYHIYTGQDGAGVEYWDGDEYTFAGLQPEYKLAVEYLRKLYTEGLLDPEYIIDTIDTVKTKMLNEENFMLLNCWRTQPTEYTRDSGYETTYVAAFYPDQPEYGKAYQTFSRANQVELSSWTVFAVDAETEHPDLMAKLINYNYLPETMDILYWGVEGVTYTVDDNGERKFVDEFFETDDPAKVADKYGLWNDRSGRVHGGIRGHQDNMPRRLSFPLNDYTYFGGKYEEAPIQDTEYFKSVEWPNEYMPPWYNAPTLDLTEEEQEETSSILTNLKTYTAQMQASFISGEKSMDEWDSFMDTFKNSYDLQKVLDIYNEAAERYFEKKEELGID